EPVPHHPQPDTGVAMYDMCILGDHLGSKRSAICLLVADSRAVRFESGQEVYGGVEGMIEHLHEFGGLYKPTVTVIEGYEVRGGRAGDPHGLEVIGAVKSWLYPKYNEPVIQPAAGRKQAVSDEALKNLGLYFAGEPQRNLREAVRHAVWYAKKHSQIPTLRGGWRWYTVPQCGWTTRTRPWSSQTTSPSARLVWR